MGLGWKTAVVALLGLLLLVLNIKARRGKYERFRQQHTRRKYRVPADENGRPVLEEGSTPEGVDPHPRADETP